MYFDAEFEKLKKMSAKKVADLKACKDQVREIENELIVLEKTRVEALDEENDQLFIELGGKIEVTKAKLQKAKEKDAFVLCVNDAENIRDTVCDTYKKEMRKKIQKLFKNCDDMMKIVDEIASLYSEMEDVSCEYREFVGFKEEMFPIGDCHDVATLKNFINKMIDPLTDKATSEKSVRSIAFRLNY